MYNYIHYLQTFSILFFLIFWMNEKIHFKRNIYFQSFPTETLAGPASSTLQKPKTKKQRENLTVNKLQEVIKS